MYEHKNSRLNLQNLLLEIRRSRLAGDAPRVATIARSLVPSESDIRYALRDGAPEEAVLRVLASFAGIPKDDEVIAALAYVAPDERTVAHAWSATPTELAATGGPPGAFPPEAQRIARSGILRHDVPFWQVALTEPGQPLGTKFHLFFWRDGWKGLGPVWRLFG